MANPERKPQWRRLDPETRRETLLEVATQHFAAKPYEDVSTIEIAAEAGVNRGLIHHYIGTKRDLYLAVLRRSMQIPRFPPLVAVGDPASLEQILSETIAEWLGDVEQAPEPWLALLRASAGTGRDSEVDLMVFEAREAAIDDALRVRFDSADVPPAVRGLLSALGALAIQAIVEWLELGRLTREQVRALIVLSALSLWFSVDEVLIPPGQPESAAAERPSTTHR